MNADKKCSITISTAEIPTNSTKIRQTTTTFRKTSTKKQIYERWPSGDMLIMRNNWINCNWLQQFRWIVFGNGEISCSDLLF